MTESYLVSVIIPTYNRAKIVLNTIQSVLNQTYSNLEVIVVSDGFDENARKAIEGIRDSRIKYYEIEHSGRPAVPRNFGINKAKGEYIALCDDDDMWMPEKLALQIDRINKDEDASLIYTKCLLKGDGKDRIVPCNGMEGFIFKELFLSSCFIATSTVLMRREVIETVGMFDEDERLKAVEDFDLWLRIAHKYKIGFVDRPLVTHRENNSSLTKGVFIKIRRAHLVPCKIYREKYVKADLFINKLLRILCKNILMLIHVR